MAGFVIDNPVGRREDVGLADLDAGGNRDGDAQFAARNREIADSRQWPRQGAAPIIEARIGRRPSANRKVERELALFGDANLVGAGEPVRVGTDRHGAGRAGGDLEPHEDRVIALVDVIHEVGDGQARRHRIAQRTCREPGRKLPFDVHRQAGIARIEPIAVPAGLGTHVNRQLDLAAGRRRAFGDQLRLDPPRLGERGHEEKRKEPD